MIFQATVSLASPGAFEEIATYRGELGNVHRRASRKLRQMRGRAAMRGYTRQPFTQENWGACCSMFSDESMRAGTRLIASYAVRLVGGH